MATAQSSRRPSDQRSETASSARTCSRDISGSGFGRRSTAARCRAPAGVERQISRELARPVFVDWHRRLCGRLTEQRRVGASRPARAAITAAVAARAGLRARFSRTAACRRVQGAVIGVGACRFRESAITSGGRFIRFRYRGADELTSVSSPAEGFSRSNKLQGFDASERPDRQTFDMYQFSKRSPGNISLSRLRSDWRPALLSKPGNC
jgi:hypothetical protein